MNSLLLKNSLLVGGLTTVSSVLLGMVTALWLAGLPRSWRNLFFALAIIDLALPPFLVTNCWLHFLGDAGVWRKWLPWSLFSLGGTVWILTLLLWPITMIAVCSAWRRLEPAQLESDMAVTGWWLCRGLLFPIARTAILQAGLLTFVLAINNFAVPAILQVKVSPAEMWIRFNTAFDTFGALQLSWPLLVAPLLTLLWFSRSDVPWPHRQPTVSPDLFRRQLGLPLSWISGTCSVFLFFVSTALPVIQLISVSRTWTELPGAVAAGQVALWNSFCFAAVAATAIVLLALLIRAQPRTPSPPLEERAREEEALSTSVHGEGRREGSLSSCAKCLPMGHEPDSTIVDGLLSPALSSRGGEGVGTSALEPTQAPARPSEVQGSRFSPLVELMVRFCLWLPFLLPGVLLGIGLIAVFNRPSLTFFYQSSGIVVLAFVIRYFALGRTVVTHALQSVDRDLTDVARLEGATRWQTARHVLWPQIGPRVLGAWYIVFLLCLWEVESMILVVPPGCETLALRIFNLLHYGHNAQVNALCLSLLGVAVLPLLVWFVTGALRRRFLNGTIAALALAAGLCGCMRSAPQNTARLDSKLFKEVQIISHRGVGVGELNKPRSVAIDEHDNLYVTDMTGRVQKFSSNGVYVLSWQMPQTDKGRPKGMCNDRQGGIVVNEPHYSRVNHFSTQGQLLAQWGIHGTNAGQLTFPRAVAVNSRHEIYVSEYGLVERVQRFTARGEKFLGSFGHAGTGPGEFNRPEGLFIDAQDRVYVADSCNHRIQVFTSDGQFLRMYGKAGNGAGELSYPYDICVDGGGRQYVCEFGNSRIQVFDAHDQPIEIIGKAGTDPGEFGNPWGVALDSAGNLFVADSQNHRVQKLICKTSNLTANITPNLLGTSKTEPSFDNLQFAILNSQFPIGASQDDAASPLPLDFGPWTLDFKK